MPLLSPSRPLSLLRLLPKKLPMLAKAPRKFRQAE